MAARILIRRSSDDVAVPISVMARFAEERERVLDGTVRMLVGRLADATRERDHLLAAAIRLVQALDAVDAEDAADGCYHLSNDQLVAMNTESDAAHEALREAITN